MELERGRFRTQWTATQKVNTKRVVHFALDKPLAKSRLLAKCLTTLLRLKAQVR